MIECSRTTAWRIRTGRRPADKPVKRAKPQPQGWDFVADDRLMLAVRQAIHKQLLVWGPSYDVWFDDIMQDVIVKIYESSGLIADFNDSVRARRYCCGIARYAVNDFCKWLKSWRHLSYSEDMTLEISSFDDAPIGSICPIGHRFFIKNGRGVSYDY